MCSSDLFDLQFSDSIRFIDLIRLDSFHFDFIRLILFDLFDSLISFDSFDLFHTKSKTAHAY